MLFHAQLVVSLSAYISFKSDNYGLLIATWTLVPIKTNQNHTAILYGLSLRVTVQFLVLTCALKIVKHCGCKKLLQNTKASKGWE